MQLIAKHFPPTVYRECYGFEREFFDPQSFFTLHSFARGMTEIHKRGMLVSSIYVPKAFFEVSVPQPWNLPFTRFEHGGFHSHETCLLLALSLHS